jgi:NitT/TauT family transport system permease protein
MNSISNENERNKTGSRLHRLRRAVKQKPQIVLAPLVFVLLIIVWEATVNIFNIPQLILPAPSAVAQSLYNGFASGSLLKNAGITLSETLGGFVVGALLGFILAVLISQFPLLESTLYPYIIAFQTLPKVSIAPIIVIWFGYGLSSKIVITATMAFFPLLANTLAGLRASEKEQRDLLTAFTASSFQIFWKLKIYIALPYIFVGLDLAIILAVIGAIVGEFVGSFGGLGYLILQRNFELDVAGMFAIFIVLSLIGTILHLTVQYIQKRVVFWTEIESERVIGA